jgi:osmotically-inducible protein OsmY
MISLMSSCTSTSLTGAFDDQRNESLARKMIEQANPAIRDANINITSFDGIVLVTGQVPSADLIQIVASEIEPLRNVRKLHNELVVAGNTSLISRTNDSWLTTKVKSALSSNPDTEANRIKVVTENEVVYLMGLLTRAEADAAVEVARNVQGIQKIVKLFEYIN